MIRKEITLSEDDENGNLIRQELISYRKIEGGLVRSTIERVFHGNDYLDCVATLPIFVKNVI